MGYKTEIAGGVLIAESRDGRCYIHHAGNHLAGTFRKHAVSKHLVAPILHDAHVDMQS